MFWLKRFCIGYGPNCGAYPSNTKMEKVLDKGDKFYYKVTRNKNSNGSK